VGSFFDFLTRFLWQFGGAFLGVSLSFWLSQRTHDREKRAKKNRLIVGLLEELSAIELTLSQITPQAFSTPVSFTIMAATVPDQLDLLGSEQIIEELVGLRLLLKGFEKEWDVAYRHSMSQTKLVKISLGRMQKLAIPIRGYIADLEKHLLEQYAGQLSPKYLEKQSAARHAESFKNPPDGKKAFKADRSDKS
jgi:hypothetical protein